MNERAISKEELIGLHVKIKGCSDPSLVDVSGYIVDETKNTFLIKIDDKIKRIPKKNAKFEFAYDGGKITIKGSKIAYRPEDRIKKTR